MKNPNPIVLATGAWAHFIPSTLFLNEPMKNLLLKPFACLVLLLGLTPGTAQAGIY